MNEMMELYLKYKMFLDVGFTGLGMLFLFGVAIFGIYDSRKRK